MTVAYSDENDGDAFGNAFGNSEDHGFITFEFQLHKLHLYEFQRPREEVSISAWHSNHYFD